LKIALTIAGSDSGGGAGIQADLKTFSALGVYGCTAITAITAQNTREISKILEVSPGMVEQQIKSIMTDMRPNAIKIGMVYSRQTIDIVQSSFKGSKIPIVLDPIFAAGVGAKLLRDDAFDSFVSKLVPMSTLITPNRIEAERLADTGIRTKTDCIEAARRIRKLGARNVIIKGGHFGSNRVTDMLLDSKGELTEIMNPRVMMGESHGSGCNFSSAVVAFLAKGAVLNDACRMANEYVHIAIKNTVRVGKGLAVTNPLSAIYRDASRYNVLVELQQAVEQVSSFVDFYKLIPETQTNFAYALPDANDTFEVAAVCGRIVRIGNMAKPVSCVKFGASRHVASSIIAYMRVSPTFRAAINIRLDERLLKVCRSLFLVSNYDRSIEPKVVKKKEGSSISWGIEQALSRNPKADVIYHNGDIGKEPMITIFGRDPVEVANKVKSILKNY
jgi:hydroxymethylpyrimidine kinase / phosphomethylpyrimidine kinase / thiamine-phosphate diphosphorylase